MSGIPEPHLPLAEFRGLMSSSYPVIRGNSLYTIVDGPSWTEAEAKAIELGGHLAAINAQEENLFIVDSELKHEVIYNSIKGDMSGNGPTASRAWIGLNDRINEGTYE